MKLLIGSLLAAIAMFIWGFISWTVLPWHNPKPFKSEAAMTQAVKAIVTEPGVYMLPNYSNADGAMKDMDASRKASMAGPYLYALIRPGANNRSMVSCMIGGLASQFVIALVLGLILMRVPLGYPCLVKMSGMMGLLVGLSSWLPNINWLEYPGSYAAPFFADYIIQSLMAGAILGKFVGQKGAKCSA